jgi:FkbM family methyltransferase
VALIGGGDMRAILPPDNEPELVREFFGTSRGYFVDVGAHAPIVDSQSWHLEQKGWTGLLIEPQPDLAERLRQERRSSVHAVACSSPDQAGQLLPLHIDGPYSSLNSTLVDRRRKPQCTKMVPIRTLDQVLSEAGAQPPIDLLSIDVEGHTCEVLEGTDLARWRPRLILVEDHVLNLRVHRMIRRRGYRWTRRTGLNSWYVPVRASAPLCLAHRMEFFRKYFLGLPFRHFRDAIRHLRSGGGALHGRGDPPNRLS